MRLGASWLGLVIVVSGVGCGGDVSPSNPDDLSGVLVIPGAVREQGSPPAASGGGDAPSISGGGDVSVVGSNQGRIVITFSSPTGYRNCYVQVRGARDYFRIPANDATTSGRIEIPFSVRGGVSAGSFDLYSCIAGSNGRVSNPINTRVSFTPESSGGGGGDTCQSTGTGCATIQSCCNASSCWYVWQGQRYPCAGFGNCSAAAQQVGNLIARSCR